MNTKSEYGTHAEVLPRGNPCTLAYSPLGRLTRKYHERNSVMQPVAIDIAYGWYAREHQIIKHMTVSNCDDYQPQAVKRMFDYNRGTLYDMRWEEEQSSGVFDSVAVNKPAGNFEQVSITRPDEMVEAGRFTFTGKERDEETGYGYFGARYMDHELMTMWLSVDPMADKYPSISPYAYCAWNPVKLVDPDGREFGDYYAQNFWGTWKKIGSDNHDDGKVYVVPFKEDQKKVKNGDFNIA